MAKRRPARRSSPAPKVRAKKPVSPSKPRSAPTQEEIGRALGVVDRQVRNLVNAGMPVDSIDAAREWHTKYKADAEAKKRAPGPLTKGKLREQELKNRALELDVAEREATLITAELARSRLRELNTHYVGAIRALLQYGWELFGVTAHAEFQQGLERVCNKMLAIGRGDEVEEAPEAPEPENDTGPQVEAVL